MSQSTIQIYGHFTLGLLYFVSCYVLMLMWWMNVMIMNIAVAVAVTELFVTSWEAGSPFIVLAQCWRLKVSKNVSVSALQGLGLVSWQKSGVSVLWNCRKVLVSVSSRTKNRMSRSRKLRSCLHPCRMEQHPICSGCALNQVGPLLSYDHITLLTTAGLIKNAKTSMWANAQRDGRPAKYRCSTPQSFADARY